VRPSDAANGNLPATRVNLFLYQVTPNPHRNNLDLPTRSQQGDLVQRPQIALDLHYLMSFTATTARSSRSGCSEARSRCCTASH